MAICDGQPFSLSLSPAGTFLHVTVQARPMPLPEKHLKLVGLLQVIRAYSQGLTASIEDIGIPGYPCHRAGEPSRSRDCGRRGDSQGSGLRGSLFLTPLAAT